MTNLDTKALEAALLPCPLCGNAHRPRVSEYDGGVQIPGFIVVCSAVGWGSLTKESGCGASTGWAETREEAIAMWNRRASPRSILEEAASKCDRLFDEAKKEGAAPQILLGIKWCRDELRSLAKEGENG